jgi:hypothetical protein
MSLSRIFFSRVRFALRLTVVSHLTVHKHLIFRAFPSAFSANRRSHLVGLDANRACTKSVQIFFSDSRVVTSRIVF